MNHTVNQYNTLSSLATQLRATQVRGRYAPSPTGPLHLGNLRTALLAWLQARLSGGQFVLRMEDIDQPRVKTGSAQQSLDDLHWMGLDWDEGPNIGGPVGPYEQSSRIALYETALQRLHFDTRLFPCFCSRKDIARAASAPHGNDTTNIYPGTCRDMTLEQGNQQKSQQHRDPAWRYRVPEQTISFDDQIVGHVVQTLHKDVGDFVLQRADAQFAYQLAVVVDDGLMGITDVVRGVDLLDSTPRQIELFNALGFTAPRFWHVPLLHDSTGKRMAKRDGAESVATLRAQGISAEELIGTFAASLGLIPKKRKLTARDLLASLDLMTFRQTLINSAADV